VDKSEVIIRSAFEVDPEKLLDFYRTAFLYRFDSISKHWKWLNHTEFFSNRIPLVLLHQDRVIAHSGMIPFNIRIEGKMHTASWFIDFKVLDEFQRHGLGSIMTKEWMNYAECPVTFCNDKSLGVFKKLGWAESAGTYLHTNFCFPFSHPGFTSRLPGFFCRALNYLSYPFLYLNYLRFSLPSKQYSFEKLDQQSFDGFYSTYLENLKPQGTGIYPVRDKEYASWRVMNSPNFKKYYLFRSKRISAIVSVQDNHGNYFDILWVSKTSDYKGIRELIACMGIYGMKRKISYIRFYTSHKNLSDIIKWDTWSIVKHPKFAFYSKNARLMNAMSDASWDFELIDSDFEHLN
jgi:hypothetical protein